MFCRTRPGSVTLADSQSIPEDSLRESVARTRVINVIETMGLTCRYYPMDRTAKLLRTALFLAIGCGQPAEVIPGADAIDPAAVRVSGLPLGRVLEQLEARLDTALADGPGGPSGRRLAEAESITDRLIETDLPFARLADGYSLEARLRQIQALADRVMAQTRGGMDRADLEADLRALRDRVRSLRQDIARGGGPAGIPVAELLDAMDTVRR